MEKILANGYLNFMGEWKVAGLEISYFELAVAYMNKDEAFVKALDEAMKDGKILGWQGKTYNWELIESQDKIASHLYGENYSNNSVQYLQEAKQQNFLKEFLPNHENFQQASVENKIAMLKRPEMQNKISIPNSPQESKILMQSTDEMVKSQIKL